MRAIKVPIDEYKEIYQQAHRASELERVNIQLKREVELLKELLRLEKIKNCGDVNNKQLSLLKIESSISSGIKE